MEEADNVNGHDEEEVFEAEVVEDHDDADQPRDEAASADALADLAGGRADASASALDALATGETDDPVDAIAAAEAQDKPDAEDALASLASGEDPTAGDEASDPSDPSGGDAAAASFEFASGETIHVDPERIRAGREQRKRMADRADDLSFRKTMVPLMLAVGVLLLGISGLTAAITSGVDDDTPAEDLSALDEYGPMVVWAGIPLGVVLIGGAVMFHMEVRRVEAAKSVAAAAQATQPEDDQPQTPDAQEPQTQETEAEDSDPDQQPEEQDQPPASDA